MKKLINTLRKQPSDYGHFKITIVFNDVEYSHTTTNTMAIDAAFDDCYDDQDNSGRFFESREEAQLSLVSEIVYANDLDIE